MELQKSDEMTLKLPSAWILPSPRQWCEPGSAHVWAGAVGQGSSLRMCLCPPIAIDINSSDIKALYRRCQALEHLGKLDQAFKDVQRCATLEPRNQNFQETLRRLNASIQEKVSRIPSCWPLMPHPGHNRD